MNSISELFLTYFLLTCFALYSIFLYLRYSLPGTSYLKNRFGRYLLRVDLNPIYKPFLVKYFPVYNCISERDQILFERRVQKFINMKTFTPRGEIKQVTPEMKVLIAGSAVLMTIGYPTVYFSHFRTIIIYPDRYYSNFTQQYHNGEVNKLGVIVLSWKSFIEGFRDPRDGVNLAFHEMAHALKLSDIVDNDDYNFVDTTLIREFEKEGIKEMQKIKESPEESPFFRSYAATNLSEFFAVAIENYFERPLRLNEYNPLLYSYLVSILNFDILKVLPV